MVATAYVMHKVSYAFRRKVEAEGGDGCAG